MRMVWLTIPIRRTRLNIQAFSLVEGLIFNPSFFYNKTIMYLIIGLLCGIICGYLFCRPQINRVEKLNNEIKEENIKEQSENNFLKKQKEELSSQIQTLKSNIDNYYEKAKEELNLSLEKLANNYSKEEENYKQEYLNLLNESANEYSKLEHNYQEELTVLKENLDNLKKIVALGVESNKRLEEMKNKQLFYQLQLSTDDQEEIKKLKSVIPYLRQPEILNKVIYKTYYEKPYTDLVGRVIGNRKVTGIYKITNTENQMCYVGQAVDVAERWRQHIKRALGAEPATRNKLYPIMGALGPENFTFEIVEECDRKDLDKQEDFWQDYFKAKEFGYSIK